MVRDNQEIEGAAELRLDMDMSTFKDTKVGGLSETGTVQFPAEFFNTPQFASRSNDTVFNRHNPSHRNQFWAGDRDDRLATLDPVGAYVHVLVVVNRNA